MSKLKPSILITLLNLIPSKRHAQKRRKHLRSLLLVPKKVIFLTFFVFFTLASVHFAFGQSCPGDVNQDGVVDIADFGLLSANYGNTCDEPDQPEYPEGTVHCIPGGADVVEVLNPETGRIWMDRNVGASQVANTFDDEQAFGDLYQWGRFSDGHQCRNSGTTTEVSSSPQPGHGDFILFPSANSTSNDWLDPSDSDLWQGISGTNNPCPSGYRLATQTEWNEEIGSWSTENSAGAFNSPLALTGGGARDDQAGGIFGGQGHYWTSTANTSASILILINGGFILDANTSRTSGFSLRCIKNNTIAWDCPQFQLNIGDPCNDNNANTINDELNANCECQGDATEPAAYPEGTVHCIPGGAEVVEVMNPETGKIWMDRNLGASRVATSLDDDLAYGDLYQWGRFSDGHQCRDSDELAILSDSYQPNHGNFIILPENASPYDWLSLQNDDLWQGLSGINNPCPSGYRIPNASEWISEQESWTSDDIIGAFNSPLKFTASGWRNSLSGNIGFAGSRGWYWADGTPGIYGGAITMGDTPSNLGSANRSAGHSIRCIKD